MSEASRQTEIFGCRCGDSYECKFSGGKLLPLSARDNCDH